MAVRFNGNLDVVIGEGVRPENPAMLKPNRAKGIKWLDMDDLEAATDQDITLRIGLFFDGTGNNMENAIAADCSLGEPPDYDEETAEDLDVQCRDSAPGNGEKLKGSNANAPSNVARLFGLYQSDDGDPELIEEGKVACLPVYIEGIGTNPGSGDNFYGQATGRGRTGVEAKVAQCHEYIQMAFKELAPGLSGKRIKKVEFDVFGFSRGAAAARHCVNDIIRGSEGEVMGGVRTWLHAEQLSQSFRWEYGRDISVKVVGIFDTVAAIVSPLRGNMSPANNNTGSVKLYLDPANVEKAIHLCAQNEYRHNFALNSVAPGHDDIMLPGAHSDIGGGYLREDTEQRWLTPPRMSWGRGSTAAENTHAWQRAQQDLAEWKQAHPWLADHPGIRLTSWRRRRSGSRSNQGYRIYVVAEIERTVRGELSLIYLRIMHKLARQFGVPFEDITPDLAALRLPARLEPIYEKLDRQAQGGEAALTDEELSLLHREYIHLSSHWAPIGISAAMKPAEGYARIIHPHTPD